MNLSHIRSHTEGHIFNCSMVEFTQPTAFILNLGHISIRADPSFHIARLGSSCSFQFTETSLSSQIQPHSMRQDKTEQFNKTNQELSSQTTCAWNPPVEPFISKQCLQTEKTLVYTSPKTRMFKPYHATAQKVSIALTENGRMFVGKGTS